MTYGNIPTIDLEYTEVLAIATEAIHALHSDCPNDFDQAEKDPAAVYKTAVTFASVLVAVFEKAGARQQGRETDAAVGNA